jgi:hypothetical protein
MLIYHLGDEQQARWWLQFRDLVSSHRHEQQQQLSVPKVPVIIRVAYMIARYIKKLKNDTEHSKSGAFSLLNYALQTSEAGKQERLIYFIKISPTVLELRGNTA